MAPMGRTLETDVATEVIRIQNETLAEICAAHPDRFVAFASVALQHPDLAVEQLEHGVERDGLRRAGLGGSVEGHPLLGQGRGAGHPRVHPPGGPRRSGGR